MFQVVCTLVVVLIKFFLWGESGACFGAIKVGDDMTSNGT